LSPKKWITRFLVGIPVVPVTDPAWVKGFAVIGIKSLILRRPGLVLRKLFALFEAAFGSSAKGSSSRAVITLLGLPHIPVPGLFRLAKATGKFRRLFYRQINFD
jgi:hypothetical protein